LHYVFLPSRKAATFVGKDLHGRGFTTEERLGADGANWLVLARHVAVPAEAAVAAIRRSMEALVAQLGGEYDGWEADVPRHEPAAH
jgi:NAD(P)-dependent dehydrogenase (short-subunit alcohol dehydrogenase family)